MTDGYNAVLDALSDVLPDGVAAVKEGVGAPFGSSHSLFGETSLTAHLGPGTLTYEDVQAGKKIHWDLDSARVNQKDGTLFVTGSLSDIQ